MSKKSISLKKTIKSFLQAEKILRGSDLKLIAQVWYQDLHKIGLDPKKLTGYQLLEIIGHHKLTNINSIVRYRRKLQEENIELRSDKKN